MVLNRKYIHIAILFSILFLSCRKDNEIIEPDYDIHSSLIYPGQEGIQLSKYKDATEVPKGLLPSIDFTPGAVYEPSRLKSFYRNINSLNLPRGLVTISNENFMWRFELSSPVAKEIDIHLPYSDSLRKHNLTDYKELFKVYSCDQNFENWKEVEFTNDTTDNVASIKWMNQDLYYGVFFEEITVKTEVVAEIYSYNTERYYHHFTSSNDQFTTLTQKFLDDKPAGLTQDKWGWTEFYYMHQTADYESSSRYLLEFSYDPEQSIYYGDEFFFDYSTELWVTGTWYQNYTKDDDEAYRDDCTLTVLQWGEIGEVVKFRIVGYMDQYDPETGEIVESLYVDIFIQTIRCR